MTIPAHKIVPLHPIAHILAKLTGRNYKVRGRAAIRLSEVERKVSRKALMVWGAYAAYRDKDGTCWPSRERIVDVVKDFFNTEITASDVQVALRRLKKVGLIRDIKWLPLERYRKVYLREVRGRVFLSGLMWMVSLPDSVERAMSKSAGWGGKRAGAGRPLEIKSPDVSPGLTGSVGNQESHEYSDTLLLPPLPPDCLSPSEKDIAGSAVEADLKEEDLLGSLGFLPSDSAPYTGLHYAPGEHGIPVRPATVLRKHVTVPAARPFTETELANDGLVLSRMRKAYEGSIQAMAGSKRSTYTRPASALTKLRLLELARRLTKLGATPEAWFLFSASQWKRGNTTPMPLAHALSERRLADHSGWFRAVCHEYAYARTILTKTELQLNKRHDYMLALLWHHKPQTEDGIKAIVSRCFPGDSWDRMIAQVRREIDEDQARIDAMVARGVFVW